MTTANQKKPWIALLLSIAVPGLGQLYNAERPKGFSLLAIVLGIIVSSVVFASDTTFLLMGVVYLAVLLPSARDAYRVANGTASPFNGDAVWYVIGMLVAVGPFALPLLWQSQRFSRGAKIAWTVVVIVVALLGILMVAALGPLLEGLQSSMSV